jgi:transcriptional regulator with XRE-family HTH domain
MTTKYERAMLAFQINMKKRRERKLISQSALARTVGMSPPALCMMESGSRNPSLEAIFKVGEALGYKNPLEILESKTNG